MFVVQILLAFTKLCDCFTASQSRILVRTIKELMKDQKPSGKVIYVPQYSVFVYFFLFDLGVLLLLIILFDIILFLFLFMTNVKV